MECYCVFFSWIENWGMRQPVVQYWLPHRVPAKNRTSDTMACRKRQLLLGLLNSFVLFYFSPSGPFNYIECFQNPPLNSSILLAQREAGLFWCLPVWNFRAVIWFHLSICSLVMLPSPVASVFSFFCFCTSHFFWLEIGFIILFLVVFLERRGNDQLVGDKCSMLPYGTGISNVCF